MKQRGRKSANSGTREGQEGDEQIQSAVPRPPEFYKTLRRMNEGMTNAVDPLGMSAPIMHAQLAWLAHPQELAEHAMRLSSELWRLQWHTWNRAFGLPSTDPIEPHQDDMRFADPVWTESPSWD
jgi:polyhydroxyalkanoate synthase